MAPRLTVYSTRWCGYCMRLKRGLHRAGIDFDEVDIEADPEAERFVRESGDGTATVPTVRLPDGRVFVNPPLPLLLDELAAA